MSSDPDPGLRDRTPDEPPAAAGAGSADGEPSPSGTDDRESAPAADASGDGSTPGSSGGRAPFGPRAMRKPGRTETRMKDMLGAVLILIPIALLIVGVGQSCSFAPGGPQVDPGTGPRVDVTARMTEYARASTFPIRVPDVPWRSNATDRGPVEGGTAVRAGFVTGDGRYLRLVQSDASEEALLRAETGGGAVSAEGVTPAAGLNWVTYRRDNDEAVRIAAVPGVRLLITGSGTDDEFRTLAESTVRARVLPPGGAAG